MTLSTRQLADLAGTTVKTVRHYHRIGLLEVPERSSNGYKQYTVTHLLRLLQIKRLSDLGVSLSQIPAVSDVGEDLQQSIRQLDDHVAASIKRLQQIRSELKGVLRDHTPVDVPAQFSMLAREMSEADRALVMIYSRVLSADDLASLRELILDRDPLDDEYDALPPDADQDTIQNLAERYEPLGRSRIVKYPWHAPIADNGEDAESLVSQAILAFYNPAQLSFRRRVHRILRERD